MDIGVAFRGTEYAPTFALSPEVIERAVARQESGAESLILCLNGRESAGRIAELLASDPRVLFVEPVGGLQAPARRTIAAFGRLVFAHGTPAVVLIAALIAVNRDTALRGELETSRSAAVPYQDDAASD
jgi:hypothetical protein